MPSLWGSKKDDDPDSEAGAAAPRNGEQSLSNERTPLLPPPASTGREGFLSPDDPAVCFLSRHSPLLKEAFVAKTNRLTNPQGISVQPVERAFLALLHRPLCGNHLSLVGTAVGIYFRQPTWNARARFWVFRLLVHYFDFGSSTRRATILLNSLQSGTGNMSCHRRYFVD